MIETEALQPASPLRAGGARHLVLICQSVISIIAVAWIVFAVDWSEAAVAASMLSISAASTAVIVAFCSQIIAAWRLLLLLHGAGVGLSFGRCLQFTWAGLFAGNVLPTTIGGDALFAVLLHRSGFSVGMGLVALVYNRAISLLAVMLCLPLIPFLAPLRALRMDAGSILHIAAAGGLAIIGAGGLICLWWARWASTSSRQRIGRLASWLPLLAQQPWRILAATALSLGMLMLAGWAMLALAAPISPHATYSVMLATVILTMGALIVPISINGIGVQEAVIATFLLHLDSGWTLEQAISLSLLLRLLNILISIPGFPVALHLIHSGRNNAAEGRG